MSEDGKIQSKLEKGRTDERKTWSVPYYSGGYEQLRWRIDAITFSNNKATNDSNYATQSELGVAA